MSDTKKDTSDIKAAAEQADSQQIEKNLENNKAEDSKKVHTPKKLTEEEQTSFINDDLRTDK